jgi:hypothetical protein
MTDPDIPDDSSSHPVPPGGDAGRTDAGGTGETAGAGGSDHDLTDMPSCLRAFVEVSSPVNVATGIIMGTQDCSQYQAGALLQRAAYQRRLPIEAIAAGIVASMNSFCFEDPLIP